MSRDRLLSAKSLFCTELQAQKCHVLCLVGHVLCLVGAEEIDKAKVSFKALQQLAPEYAIGELEGLSLYARSDDGAPARTFLRIAADLEALIAAATLRRVVCRPRPSRQLSTIVASSAMQFTDSQCGTSANELMKRRMSESFSLPDGAIQIT